jgi:hypothetical protein
LTAKFIEFVYLVWDREVESVRIECLLGTALIASLLIHPGCSEPSNVNQRDERPLELSKMEQPSLRVTSTTDTYDGYETLRRLVLKDLAGRSEIDRRLFPLLLGGELDNSRWLEDIILAVELVRIHGRTAVVDSMIRFCQATESAFAEGSPQLPVENVGNVLSLTRILFQEIALSGSLQALQYWASNRWLRLPDSFPWYVHDGVPFFVGDVDRAPYVEFEWSDIESYLSEANRATIKAVQPAFPVPHGTNPVNAVESALDALVVGGYVSEPNKARLRSRLRRQAFNWAVKAGHHSGSMRASQAVTDSTVWSHLEQRLRGVGWDSERGSFIDH